MDIKWLVAKGEIKEFEILSVNKEKDDYIYDIRLVVQENGGALVGEIEVRYELGNCDDWTILSVYTESLDYVITGKYNGYIETKIHDGFNAGLYITNNSDTPLAVGGKALHKYGGWRRFYKVIAGNTTDIVMYSTLLSYEIDFLELPY